MRQLRVLCYIVLALFGLPTVLAMAATGTKVTAISVNNKTVALTELYTVHQVSYVPLSAVLTALSSVHGATMRGAPPNEFTVYVHWDKKKQTVILRTPRYNSPLPSGQFLNQPHLNLNLDGQTVFMPVLSHSNTTFIPMSYVETLLSHLQIHTAFSAKDIWSWSAKPMTASSIWIDDTPPFQGTDVTWEQGINAISALNNDTHITGVNWGMGASFHASAFDIVQSFQGQLSKTPFVVTLYIFMSRPDIPLIGIRYGNKVIAFSPGPGELYPINFTGKNFIIRDASNYNHWMAVSLPTGQYSLNYNNAQLVGFAKAMPPTVCAVIGPSYILGLPQHYPSIG